MTTPNQRRIESMSAQMRNTLVGLARGMTYAEIAAAITAPERSVKFWSEKLVVMLNVDRSRQVPYAYYTQTGKNPYNMEFTRE